MRRFLLLVSLLAIGLGAFMNGALFTGTAAASEPTTKYNKPDFKPNSGLANAIDSAHKFRSSSGKVASQKKTSGLKSADSKTSKKYGLQKSKKTKKYATYSGKHTSKYAAKKKAGNKTAYNKKNLKKKAYHKKSKRSKKVSFRS